MAKLKTQRGNPRKGKAGAPSKIGEPATFRSYLMPLRLLKKLERLARLATARNRAEGRPGEVTAPAVLRHAVEQLPDPLRLATLPDTQDGEQKGDDQ